MDNQIKDEAMNCKCYYCERAAFKNKPFKNKPCKNCGHLLYFDPSTNQLHHFTRSFHSWGYPYSNLKCYFGNRENHCGCMSPSQS